MNPLQLTLTVTRFLLLGLWVAGCGSAPPQSHTPAPTRKAAAPDPCATLAHDPARGPGLFFANDTTEGVGTFISAVAFTPGATFAVVADTWAVPEELPPIVTVVNSTPFGDGTYSIRFNYAATPSEPLALVGPIEAVPAPLVGRLGTGLAPAATSIGIPQVTYEVTLPTGQLFQKMLRCTQASYVEQIWTETEAESEGPVLVSSTLKKIAPPGPDLVAAQLSQRKSHLFYVHGAIVQEQGPEAVSPELGAYRFHDIVEALAETGATVHAPLRAKGTSLEQGVRTLTDEIGALLASGVDPYDIIVVGASQGGIMSLIASSNLANDQLSFVILGACSSWSETNLKLNLHGRILSIYETGDPFGSSCSTTAAKSTGVRAYRELPLYTGLKHGFLYRPLPEWINPTLRWAQHLDVAPWGP